MQQPTQQEQKPSLEVLMLSAFEGQHYINETLLTLRAELMSMVQKLQEKDATINALQTELDNINNAEATNSDEQ
jgi:hypothetical protein